MKLLAGLHAVIESQPKTPVKANHLYIHAVEALLHPQMRNAKQSLGASAIDSWAMDIWRTCRPTTTFVLAAGWTWQRRMSRAIAADENY